MDRLRLSRRAVLVVVVALVLPVRVHAGVCPILNGPITSAGIANPGRAAVADVNADGVPDLLSTNDAAQFAVQLGLATYLAGNGQFGAPTLLPGVSARRIAIADFNGDGILDVVNTTPTALEVRLGQGAYGVGDGTFAAPTTMGITGSPETIVVGDFNEDGILDLAIGLTQSPYSVAILLGNGTNGVGDGTFASPGHYATAATVRTIVTGDFNEDGRTDLAALIGGNAIEILLGNGTGGRGNGGFTVSPFTVVNSTGTGLVTGDFNHDGITDLAFTEVGAGYVDVMAGNGTGGVGNGTFAAPVRYRAGLASARDLAVADFNGDGIADLVTTLASDSLVVMSGGGSNGAGDGTFHPTVTVPCTGSPAALLVGDFRNDGVPDALVITSDSSKVQVFPGACPAFQPVGLHVLSPNGGESLTLGTEATFTWSRGAGVVAVDLQLTRDSVHWQTLASSLTDTTFAWSVTPPITGSARVRVLDPTVPSRHDDSDATFSVSPSATAVASPAVHTLALAIVGANPFSRGTVVRADVPRACVAVLDVLDARGRRVRRLLGGPLEAGSHELDWDGRDAGGHRVPPGIYLARLTSGAGERTQKLVRVP